MRFLLLMTAACLVAQSPPDPIASFGAADLDYGKKLFIAHCAPCHGIDGSGGRGANLTMPKLKRASDNAALFALIRDGIPGSSMDGAWQLSDNEIWRLAAYVRQLGRSTQAAPSADVSQGRALYAKLGCSGCHIIAGAGASLGPELTAIGAQRSAAYLKEALLDPGAAIPSGYTLVALETHDGRHLRGLRVNEDSFTIQIKDLTNHYHSFRKADLARLEVESHKSAMPSYSGRLSASEIDGFVAYLASLRGEQ
jgi:putative heme-binding domain-containing protein